MLHWRSLRIPEIGQMGSGSLTTARGLVSLPVLCLMACAWSVSSATGPAWKALHDATWCYRKEAWSCFINKKPATKGTVRNLLWNHLEPFWVWQWHLFLQCLPAWCDLEQYQTFWQRPWASNILLVSSGSPADITSYIFWNYIIILDIWYQVISGDVSWLWLKYVEFVFTPRWFSAVQRNPWIPLDRPGFHATLRGSLLRTNGTEVLQHLGTKLIHHAIRYESNSISFLNDIQCVEIIRYLIIWSGFISWLQQNPLRQLNASEVLTGPTDGKVLSSWTLHLDPKFIKTSKLTKRMEEWWSTIIIINHL